MFEGEELVVEEGFCDGSYYDYISKDKEEDYCYECQSEEWDYYYIGYQEIGWEGFKAEQDYWQDEDLCRQGHSCC